jgi:hypothetical protein
MNIWCSPRQTVCNHRVCNAINCCRHEATHDLLFGVGVALVILLCWFAFS